MIGLNVIEFNDGTMRVALQEYLNNRATWDAKVEVTSITKVPNCGAFRICVKPLEPVKRKS